MAVASRTRIWSCCVLAGVLLSGACASSSGEQTSASADRTSSTTRAADATTSSSTTASSTTVAPTTASTDAPTTMTTTTAPTTTTPTTTTTTEPPLPREAGDLAGGSVGARTQGVQKALSDQKYDPGPADGKFGLKTTQAVWAWQALHGLARTGVLTADMERAVLVRAPQPMLRPDLGPTHSEVDLGRQVLLVFQGGRPELITHVSTGSGRHYCDRGHCGTAVTPAGSYHYQRRVKGWRHAPLGLLYNPIYFNGGIAVHGAPSVPNVPASHGCVRIPMHIAQYYPGLVANGEPIAVM